MKVLVACEFSGRVRDAFIAKGHDAMSCDLLPSETPGPHYQGDVFDVINDGWDLMIAHPPCTHLAVSGARWFAEKRADGRQQESIEFFMKLANADIPRIAIENPVSIMSKLWRKPDQIIQPYMFGDPYSKKTCLWLKNLQPLESTNVVEPNIITYKDGSRFSADYGWSSNTRRSTTYQGIAYAMAEQWGGVVNG
jgi:hypothetical protein